MDFLFHIDDWEQKMKVLDPERLVRPELESYHEVPNKKGVHIQGIATDWT